MGVFHVSYGLLIVLGVEGGPQSACCAGPEFVELSRGRRLGVDQQKDGRMGAAPTTRLRRANTNSPRGFAAGTNEWFAEGPQPFRGKRCPW